MTVVRRVAASGWWPALLLAGAAVVLLHRNGQVPVEDILAFAAWFLWACTLPGTLLWRALDWRRGAGRRGGRPLIEDVVLGSIIGIVAVVPLHLGAVALGLPHLTLAWPLAVLGGCAVTRPGRDLLLSRQATPTPVWWSWSLALVLLYPLLWSGQGVWLDNALSPESFRAPYVDEPYHLALVAEFAHHFPGETPYVDGTPLRYHWFVYPFIAAGVVGSDVAPIALLRLLAPALLDALLVLGVAVSAARLSGRRWAALAGVIVLCVLSPLDVMGWTPNDSPWLAGSWSYYLSPTQTMANALCPLLVVMLVGMLRGAWRGSPAWIATAVVMLAVAGAKSAMLPLFVAGLCGTALVLIVLLRRVPWRVVGLAGLSIAVFGLATAIFYGSGSRAMSFGPFQVVDRQALRLGLVAPDEPVDSPVRLALTAVYLICWLVPLAGGVGLFVRGGWRRPTGWVLAGCLGAGLGVLLTFEHPGLAQTYFRASAVVPATLLAVLGWARVAGRMTRRLVLLQASAALVGAVAALVIAATTATTPPAQRDLSGLDGVLDVFGVPLGLAATTIAVAATAITVVFRRMGLQRHVLPVCIALLVGFCLPSPVARTAGFVEEQTTTPTKNAATIEPGGLAAATWLRDHSHPDDLVATTLHQHRPRGPAQDRRSFWVSAWTERRVLVEGWAYVEPTSVGLPSTEENNRSGGPPTFWDPARLALNDAVFTNPTEENIRELRDRYGVDWLLAEDRAPWDVEGLAELTEVAYRNENYVVFRISDDLTG